MRQSTIGGQPKKTAFGVAASDVVATTPGPQQRVDVPKAHRRRRRRRRQPVPSIEATAPTAFDAGVGGWSPEVVRDMQLRDAAVVWLEFGSRPPWTDVRLCSPMLPALWQQYDSLCIRNGILYRSFYDEKGMVSCYQLVLPLEIKVPFLELIHADAAGHPKVRQVRCTCPEKGMVA